MSRRSRPKFSSLTLQIYRALYANPRLARHTALMFWSFLKNYTKLIRERLRAERPNTIAIALIEHMGDIVAAEPVSRFARQQHPDAQLTWVVRRPYTEIVNEYRSLDRILIVTCMTEWLLLWASGIYEDIWDLHISERACPRCHVSFSKPGVSGRVTYETYYSYGNLLTVNCLAAGISPLLDGPVLPINSRAEYKVSALNLPHPYVVIHCKPNEKNREWSIEKWEDLAPWITEDLGLGLVEVGSEPYLIKKPSYHMLSTCGTLSLVETAEVIRRAALFIGIDSGPAHLANAVGTPGIIIIGQYQKFCTQIPYSGAYADGSNADIVRADGPPSAVSVDRIKAIVAERLKNLVKPER